MNLSGPEDNELREGRDAALRLTRGSVTHNASGLLKGMLLDGSWGWKMDVVAAMLLGSQLRRRWWVLSLALAELPFFTLTPWSPWSPWSGVALASTWSCLLLFPAWKGRYQAQLRTPLPSPLTPFPLLGAPSRAGGPDCNGSKLFCHRPNSKFLAVVGQPDTAVVHSCNNSTLCFYHIIYGLNAFRYYYLYFIDVVTTASLGI